MNDAERRLDVAPQTPREFFDKVMGMYGLENSRPISIGYSFLTDLDQATQFTVGYIDSINDPTVAASIPADGRDDPLAEVRVRTERLMASDERYHGEGSTGRQAIWLAVLAHFAPDDGELRQRLQRMERRYTQFLSDQRRTGVIT